MDKRVAFIGVMALILVLLPSFAIAQSENSNPVDIFIQIWNFVTGSDTADETTETIETPLLMESREEDQISDSGIAIQEGATTSLPYHETREGREFEVVPVQEYNISLYTGWNLVSTPYQLVNETFESFLDDVDGKWNILQMHSKDDCKSGDWFWCKNKVGTSLPNQIGKISNLRSYWINISTTLTEDDNITATGIHYYKVIEIQLYNSTYSQDNWDGWNMLGYPRNSSVTVENFLDDSLSSSWTLFETYENGEWLYAIEETPVPLRDTIWTLHNVTPTKGYFIKMAEDDILVIPETARPY